MLIPTVKLLQFVEGNPVTMTSKSEVHLTHLRSYTYITNALCKMDSSLLDVAVTKNHFCMFSVLTNRMH